jgi:hypothetical protein
VITRTGPLVVSSRSGPSSPFRGGEHEQTLRFAPVRDCDHGALTTALVVAQVEPR